MSPWLLACLVACCVGAWAPAIHAQGAFEDCCLSYHTHIRLPLLRRAHSYQRQDVSGSCNLPAVIFFFPRKNKMVCGKPGAKWVQDGMKILDNRHKKDSKPRHSGRRFFQGPYPGERKLSSRISMLPLLKFSGPTRGSKRKASLLTTANPGQDS
uniref:C-C motif chemokine 25 n=1 Tax=Catagonus wagneri TaxID=51154 RepID=A0A8C3WWH4_9CETA